MKGSAPSAYFCPSAFPSPRISANMVLLESLHQTMEINTWLMNKGALVSLRRRKDPIYMSDFPNSLSQN